MLTVLDDDIGSIPICELSEFDVVFIRYLLRNESIDTSNPTIKEQTDRLYIQLKSSPDCELIWSDVFLISSLLLNESVETNNPKTKEQADRLLAGFESAAKSIIESVGNMGIDDETLYCVSADQVPVTDPKRNFFNENQPIGVTDGQKKEEQEAETGSEAGPGGQSCL